jgi:uncharacterized protein YbaR (Trm112 family)
LHPKVDVPNIFGELFDYLYEYNPWYARFHRSLPDMFWMEYEWDGNIEIEIRERSPLDLDNPRFLKKIVVPRESLLTSLKRTGVTLADGYLPAAAKRGITSLRRKKRAPARHINLEALLACPACGGDVRVMNDAVKCERCGRAYPVERGLPHMLLDQEMRNRPPDAGSAATDLARV